MDGEKKREAEREKEREEKTEKLLSIAAQTDYRI